MPGGLSYGDVGATQVGERDWSSAPSGFRRFERTVLIGDGRLAWDSASSAVLRWGVKTRSGFAVALLPGEELRVGQGQDRSLIAKLGPWRLREPVRVVAVVDRADRCGFAYGT